MDTIETPYEEEAEFIQCTVCDKSIRGDTLYKIHLTTPGHIKKEDVFVAAVSIKGNLDLPAQSPDLTPLNTFEMNGNVDYQSGLIANISAQPHLVSRLQNLVESLPRRVEAAVD